MTIVILDEIYPALESAQQDVAAALITLTDLEEDLSPDLEGAERTRAFLERAIPFFNRALNDIGALMPCGEEES